MKQPTPSNKTKKGYHNYNILGRLKKHKYFAVLWGAATVIQILAPLNSFALTGGPSSPDFSSFEPVATTNMVNDFTGQFAYNIPLIEIPGASGGGYAMSLSYHSGDGPESEASWVGAGWTLNPGSINRVKRGIPDDYKGNEIKYYNDVPPVWTIAATQTNQMEYYSVTAGLDNTVRYNNYKGFALSNTLSIGVLNGVASLGYTYEAGSGSFSVSVNPAQIISMAMNYAKRNPSSAGSTSGRQLGKIVTKSLGQSMRRAAVSFTGHATTRYVNYLLADVSSPYNVTPYEGKTIKYSGMMTVNPGSVQVGMSTGLNFEYSRQKAVTERTLPAVGYMYSAYDTGSIMDYTVEHESTYNPQDLFLPVPTSTPDGYFVSGEGLGGSFRMYQDHIGIYGPNNITSHTTAELYGFDAHWGMTNGAGQDVLINGSQDLTVGRTWVNGAGNSSEYKHAAYDGSNISNMNEGPFFRFNNDLGGKVTYGGDGAECGALGKNGPNISVPKKMLKDGIVPSANRSARASYIGFHTNEEIRKKKNGKRYLAYELNDRINSMASRDVTNSHIDNMVGEISVYNEEGNNYVYGLPVYSSMDKNIMQSLTNVQSGENYITTATPTKSKVGEEYLSPFISSYLLTQITTPDYIDLNLNGPDDMDFGGYTRFMYKPVYTISSKSADPRDALYKWRTPFKGMYYKHMKYSDPRDNMGAYQSGFREVYVLDTIETKTHYAIFVTNSRHDAWSAKIDDDDAAKGLGYDSLRDKSMVKLKEIRLYAKSMDTTVSDKLIKTVHFEYDYSSWPGVYNNYTGASGNTGKLTLKKVWFEYNGVVNAAISPYEFEYTYPNVTYPSKYSYIHDEMNNSSVDQEPAYNPYIDCWGNYMYDGQNRRNKGQNWTSQKPGASFDPAAWQLKRIILPSGGEIHVQYEQQTYGYVQNRSACAMVSLENTEGVADATKFYLNLNGLDIDASDKQRLADRIREEFVSSSADGGLFMYYKFYYSLRGNNPPSNTLPDDNCNGEYVDGYAKVVNTGVESGKVFVEFDEPKPWRKCIEYIKREVGGNMLNSACNQPGDIPSDPGEAASASKIKNMATSLFNAAKAHLSPSAFFCKSLNADMSYLRIPIWNKKGGGIRVKRLLMYDKGIESSTENLYGTEYHYEDSKGNSYGVATNEPYENMEENPMVDYRVKRTMAPWKGDIVHFLTRRYQGPDDDQFRGPLSMLALPSPSIGYSRVIKHNIHEDKYTGSGYTVVDYLTAKHYPYDNHKNAPNGHGGFDYTDIVTQNPQKKPKWDIGLFSLSISSDLYAMQGYSFIQHDMHGQLRSVRECPGNYFAGYDEANTPFVSTTEYDYYEPGEQIPMYDFFSHSVYYDNPGKEMDITIDQRSVNDNSSSVFLTMDETVGYIPPIYFIPYIVVIPIASENHQSFNSVVTNKTVHYPVILKSVKTERDGVVQLTENVAFNPMTCKAAVTRTYDGHHGFVLATSGGAPHNGTITEYNIPASAHFESMGQKAWSERYHSDTSFSVTQKGSNTRVYIAAGVNKDQVFREGDMVAIFNGSGGVGIAHIIDVDGYDVELEVAGRYNTTLTAGTYTKMEILHANYTNQLSASMGGMLEYGEDTSTNKMGPFQFCKEMNDSLRQLKMRYPIPDSVTINVGKYRGHLIYSDDPACANGPCNLEQQYVYKIKIFKKITGTPPTIEYEIRSYDKFNQELVYLTQGYDNDNPCGPGTKHDFAGPGVGGTWSSWYSGFSDVVNCLPNGFSGTGSQKGFYFINSNATFSWSWAMLFIGCGTNNWQYPVRWCLDFSYRDDGILKASNTLYKDDWDYDTNVYQRPLYLNEYEQGKKGKWRPYETYVYRDTAYPGSDVSAGFRNYKMAGVSFKFLKSAWDVVHLPYPMLWDKTSSITKYSPHGFAIQEENINGIPSSAKYGYNGMLPYMSTQNGTDSATRFESFENMYPIGYAYPSALNYEYFAGNFTTNYTQNEGHTGRKSFKNSATSQLKFEDVYDRTGKGHIVRFWAKINSQSDSTKVATKYRVKADGTSIPVRYVGRSGNGAWVLYEARYTGKSPKVPKDKVTFEFLFSTSDPEDYVYIDDVKIQPMESKASTYVYDNRTFRLWAAFDDDHFPTIYQYNAEGKLIRKKKETIQGTRTVEEAQYHIPPKMTLKDINNN